MHETAPLVAREQSSRTAESALGGKAGGAEVPISAVRRPSSAAVISAAIQVQTAGGRKASAQPAAVPLAAHAGPVRARANSDFPVIAALRKASLPAAATARSKEARPAAMQPIQAVNTKAEAPAMVPLPQQQSAYMLSEAEEDDALLAEAQALHTSQIKPEMTRDAHVDAAQKSLSGGKKGPRTLWGRLFCCM